MALTNPHYLIQKGAEAYEQMNKQDAFHNRTYWLGQAETYESILKNSFDSMELDEYTLIVAENVFKHKMSYDAAMNAATAMVYGDPSIEDEWLTRGY